MTARSTKAAPHAVAPPQLGQDAPAAYAELQCRSHFSFLTGRF